MRSFSLLAHVPLGYCFAARSRAATPRLRWTRSAFLSGASGHGVGLSAPLQVALGLTLAQPVPGGHGLHYAFPEHFHRAAFSASGSWYADCSL